MGECVAVMPAKDEAERIARTVRAVAALPEVAEVIVVDDGSTDRTAEIAREAGASVVRHARNRGKAAAMTSGAAHAASVRPDAALLFVDADLEDSAGALGVLVGPVVAGEADLTIAVLPPQQTSGGGHGFVVRLSRNGIQRLTGFDARQPLSGMRCLTREAFDTAQPFARGWGVETGMTIDVLNAGLRVQEVPCELHHRVTGADWRGQLHRAKQYRDVWLALAERRLRGRRRESA